MEGKILVTGATGTIGSEVIKQLSSKQADIRAAVHSISKAENLKEYNEQVVELDYNKPETFETALKGIEKVFCLVMAHPAVGKVSKTFAEAAKKEGVKHLVKLSAYGADAGETFILAANHRLSEKAIEESGIAFTHLRPNVFMQNFINYYGTNIKSEGKLHLPHGDAGVGFIDTRDVAAAAAEVLTSDGHEGKAYTLTGPESISYYDAVKILSEAAGKTICYVDVPKNSAIKEMKNNGAPGFMIKVWINMADFTKSGGFSPLTNTFEEITGRKPITFKQFANDHFRDFIG